MLEDDIDVFIEEKKKYPQHVVGWNPLSKPSGLSALFACPLCCRGASWQSWLHHLGGALLVLIPAIERCRFDGGSWELLMSIFLKWRLWSGACKPGANFYYILQCECVYFVSWFCYVYALNSMSRSKPSYHSKTVLFFFLSLTDKKWARWTVAISASVGWYEATNT